MNKGYAIVTGASKGIGLSMAKELVDSGYTVYGLSRRPGRSKDIIWKSCDITDSLRVREVFAEIIEETKRVDVLVCNAGIGISGAVEFTHEEAYAHQMEVNFNGTVNCAIQVIPTMRENQKGKILFISSLAAIFPLPFQGFYSASKSAVNTFCDALGIELAPFGIETCTIMLNDVKTDFTDNREKVTEGGLIYKDRIEKSVSKMEESERNGMSPDTVAKVVCKLLKRKHLPPHKIVGISNEFLGFLCRILPAKMVMRILGKMYG